MDHGAQERRREKGNAWFFYSSEIILVIISCDVNYFPMFFSQGIRGRHCSFVRTEHSRIQYDVNSTA